MTVRVRISPSPTGSFHVGGARTALFNYLLAKQTNGKFILRIEDTDRTRYNPDAVTDLITALDWLGLNWDEGPSYEELINLGVNEELALKHGKHNNEYPYVQTNRIPFYLQTVRELIDRSKAYYCFDDERINYWRTLPRIQGERIRQSGKEYTVRLKLPHGGTIHPFDSLRNTSIDFRWSKLKDPIILKSDGIPTYHLAHVVDDHYMGITHVLRGDEWISSFPLHWFMYQVLEWTPPKYFHIPLIMNPNGKGKISKRYADNSLMVFVNQYKEKGYLPEAMINFLALLGWNSGSDKEFWTMDELINKFSLSRVGLTGAAWNPKKLNWFNQQYISRMSDEEFLRMAKEFII